MPSGKPFVPRPGGAIGHHVAVPMGPLHWRADAKGECVWLSPAWAALTGQDEASSLGIGWMDRVHPDDRATARRAWQRALATGLLAVDLRVQEQDGTTYRWLRARAQPTDGASAEWSGTAIDVSDLHARLRAEQEARAGLHHRIRNTLAVIRSIARRTAENSDTVEAHRNLFDGRLGAFARTQSHIMRSGSRGVDLEALLADELLANQAGFGDRVSYSGPEVRLSPQIADQIGLAFHELAENAVQFGALGNDQGELQIRWWIEGEAEAAFLHFDWREDMHGGVIMPPEREGFGTELLTRSLVYELDAEVTMNLTPNGLLCAIRLPLA